MTDANRNRKQLGTNGETVVQAYLKRLGWEIVAVNFRCVHGEMDVIARETQQGNTILAFVEVKTRRGGQHGMPIEAVDARKQSRLIAIAQTYLAEQAYGGDEPACRFDIAEVFSGPDNLMTVLLHRAAFIIE
jgi:putative endonuclease